MLSINTRAQRIRLLILDVDGILTTGALYYSHDGIEVQGFHITGGLGIKLLQQAGIQVALLSGRRSQAVEQRASDLGITHAYLGYENKLPIYLQIKNELSLQDNEIAYMGDDLPDLPVLNKAGLAITVPHAPHILQQQAHLITTRSAGQGAVREICELILQAQNKYHAMIESFNQP